MEKSMEIAALSAEQIEAIIAEHHRRAARNEQTYNPIRGAEGAPERVKVTTPDGECPTAWVPRDMVSDPTYPTVQADVTAWRKLRCRHDFEYWSAVCCKVKHKITGRDVPLILNHAQRRVVEVLECDRRAERPLRLILLKARQWGGSTVVQAYMAWIQSCHRRNWHSLICAHVKDTSSAIRGMYTKMLDNYPRELWEGDEEPRFRPFERTLNVREIAGRGCRVTVSSVENQDAVRGYDFAMAHLTETAFWPATPHKAPEDMMRAVCGSVPLIPLSLVVMESTANGTGNFFHSEWVRCRTGKGDKRAVFVPWYEIEFNRLKPDSYEEFVATLTSYEQWLWEQHGCDLDQINWYRHKLLEQSNHLKVMAEYPTTDVEAFAATSTCVFSTEAVERLREGCRPGQPGAIEPAGFTPDAHGAMIVWERPVKDAAYVAAVDVGGRTDRADWSVVAVLRTDCERPEVVAQWRGHIDHDILAEVAMNIGYWYNDALLAVESNSLENGAGLYILNRMSESYRNMYRRRSFDSVSGSPSDRVGFHTNRQTKEMIITGLIGIVRQGGYIERDSRALDEMLTYEQNPSGAYAARPGKHDDILMTRAIALYVCAHEPTITGPVRW